MSTISALELDDPVFARSIHRVRQLLGGTRVALRFAPDDPAGAFCAAARTADLLVIGAETAAAARVLAEAAGPVVAVRPIGAGPRGLFPGHVVVAVAGAGVDPLPLEFGFDYAATHRVPLAAVHVSARLPGDFWFDERTLETRFAVEPPALGVLGAAVEPMLPRYPRVAVRLGALTGEPVRRLLDAARGARLTVVGRRPRRPGIRLVGSVSRGVLAGTDGPVAMVPAR
jgi:nucleotide-binding universal stress UspA family protein